MKYLRCWIIYDSRAAGGETDDASIYETCDSLAEAQREVKRTWHDGQIFVCTVRDGVSTDEEGPLEGSGQA